MSWLAFIPLLEDIVELFTVVGKNMGARQARRAARRKAPKPPCVEPVYRARPVPRQDGKR